MNKTKVATLAAKTAARHPKPALRSAKFAVRHRKGLLRTARVTRKTRQAAPRLIARASEPGFRGELGSAAAALAAAAKRSQRVGATKAVKDERVGESLRDVASHLRAAFQEPEPAKPKTHRLRNVALALAVAGGAYVALKRR